MPVTRHLKQPTRTLGRAALSSSRLSTSLFGFAPDGVYHADCVTTDPVRSYRTLSALPNGHGPFSAQAGSMWAGRWAVYSLLHFPWGCPRWSLSSILPCGVRTFLPHPMVQTIARSSFPWPQYHCIA